MPDDSASDRRRREYDKLSMYDKRKWPKCGRLSKRSGRPCMLVAGMNTDHFGEGPCYRHQTASDLTPLNRIRAETYSMSKPIATNPTKAMQFILDVTFGQLVYVYWKVSLLDESEYWVEPKNGGTPYLNKHIRHLKSLKEETMRYAKAAGDLGIAERMTTLAENQAVLISQFVRAVVGDLKLTDDQQVALGPAIRAHTKMLVGQNAGAAVSEIINQDGSLAASV